MMRLAWVGTACLTFALSAAGNMARATPQDQKQTLPQTSAEYNAYRAAQNGNDAQDKIKLLDDFASKYPNSTLIPETYSDYYLSFFSLKNYPQTITYADKVVALGDKIELNSRMLALISREVAFSLGCGDSAFRTPEAFAKTRDAASLGLQMLSQWRKPDDISEEQFAAEKRTFGIIFNQVSGIGESGLKGDPVNCVPRPRLNDPGKFERMINELRDQGRQSSRVR
jgi:hypothetical protein